MRRRTAVTIALGFGCLLLVPASNDVASRSYGPALLTEVAFAVAGVLCLWVAWKPGNRWLRPGSGAAVGFAWAWRATSVFITWLQGGDRSFYGVILYVTLATVFTVGWADMLPSRPRTRDAVSRLRQAGER